MRISTRGQSRSRIDRSPDVRRSRRGPAKVVSASVALMTAVVLTGCAGGVGASGGDGNTSAGEGVPYGASKEEFQEALADMAPVQLRYQASSSPTSYTADRERAFADRVTEWSDGKITFDISWGQPIAPLDGVTEAVAAGTIDIGYEVPIYSPNEYPAINDLVVAMADAPASPFLSEMVAVAAAEDVAWNTEEIVADYEDKGVTALAPVQLQFSNALQCTSPATTLTDIDGKQSRIGSVADAEIFEALGGTGVSLQYTEAYEALQRNTIDCSLNGLVVGVTGGLLDVAPYVTVPTEASLGRSPNSLIAGGKFDSLPLAGQQLVFDSLIEYFAGGQTANLKYAIDAVEAVDAAGGEFGRLDAEAEAALESSIDELHAGVAGSENLDGERLLTDIDAALDKWTGIAEDLGYEDYEDWNDLAETVDDPDIAGPFAERLYEEAYMQHRPS